MISRNNGCNLRILYNKLIPLHYFSWFLMSCLSEAMCIFNTIYHQITFFFYKQILSRKIIIDFVCI